MAKYAFTFTGLCNFHLLECVARAEVDSVRVDIVWLRILNYD